VGIFPAMRQAYQVRRETGTRPRHVTSSMNELCGGVATEGHSLFSIIFLIFPYATVSPRMGKLGGKNEKNPV
jgi:hypothetical protein